MPVLLIMGNAPTNAVNLNTCVSYVKMTNSRLDGKPTWKEVKAKLTLKLGGRKRRVPWVNGYQQCWAELEGQAHLLNAIPLVCSYMLSESVIT